MHINLEYFFLCMQCSQFSQYICPNFHSFGHPETHTLVLIKMKSGRK